MQRIQSLDGLRAVSILLVIVGHISLMFGNQPLFGQWAVAGVRIFFAISGLLITSLLQRELENTGKVSLRNFYIRRSLRIFPLAYAFILTVALLVHFRVVEVGRNELLLASTYLMSYKLEPHNALSHLWSLSVEEQFYLLWPAVFLISGKHRAQICLAVIFASPFLRLAWWFLLPDQRMGIGRAFPTIMDSIAFGCYAALDDRFVRKVSRVPAYAIVAAPIAAWMLLTLPQFMQAGIARAGVRFIADSFISLALAAFVSWCAVSKGTLVLFLNSRPMVYVGTISYSLYIWQQLFVERSNPTWVSAAMSLVAIFAVAIAAHYVIEQPCLNLRSHFNSQTPLVAVASQT